MTITMGKAVLRRAAALLLAGCMGILPALGEQMDAVVDVMTTPNPYVDLMPTEYEKIPDAYNTYEPMGLPECERVDDSYFDDAVFIGDSVTQKLEFYVKAKRKEQPDFLGKAKFLAVGSMGSGNVLGKVTSKSLHPTYQGQKMTVEDAVAACGANKVFIMLGMNDVYAYGKEKSVEHYATLVNRIREKSPNCKIFVEAVTPRIKGYDREPTTKSLFEYDQVLYDYVLENRENDIYYVDVAYAVRDDEVGALVREYCSDADGMGIHFTDAGCAVWVDYLYTHALPQ